MTFLKDFHFVPKLYKIASDHFSSADPHLVQLHHQSSSSLILVLSDELYFIKIQNFAIFGKNRSSRWICWVMKAQRSNCLAHIFAESSHDQKLLLSNYGRFMFRCSKIKICCISCTFAILKQNKEIQVLKCIQIY